MTNCGRCKEYERALQDANIEIAAMQAGHFRYRELVRSCIAESAWAQENGKLRNTLIEVRQAVNEGDCRGDEDCDHCQIIYGIIDPALGLSPCPHSGALPVDPEKCADCAKEKGTSV